MPEKETLRRARADKRAGKSASTQAGEFVRQEIHHIREGKHGAKNTKQAIAIGLSEARRAGVKLPPRGASSTRKTGARHRKSSPRRARASRKALRRQGHHAASRKALARQAHSAARRRSASARSASARKAARTRKHEARS
jgi:hypothetical protein